MIKATKYCASTRVEYEGKTNDIVLEFAAILKCLLNNDDLESLILLTTHEVVDNKMHEDIKIINELTNKKENK